MGFIFEGLIEGTITLAVIYLLLGLHICHRLFWVQNHSTQGMNSRKLFVMTLLLTAIVRCMSFTSMTLLSLGSVDFQIEAGMTTNNDDDDNSNMSNDEDFFNKATIALFDFPDFYYISAYVLLLIVWSEMYLKSRRHWMSAKRFQCLWMWSYFIFNIIIYTAQITLYTLLFLPKVDHVVETNLIFLTLSAFNIGIPLVWLAFFFYMTILVSLFSFFSASTC